MVGLIKQKGRLIEKSHTREPHHDACYFAQTASQMPVSRRFRPLPVLYSIFLSLVTPT
ncbi:hypothetical protein LX69_02867, partial [Breznakibacter xylanolyticus]